jgi:hypothetical protein
MGRAAMGLLMDIIAKKEGKRDIVLKEKIILNPILHLRDSSARNKLAEKVKNSDLLTAEFINQNQN